MTTKLEILLLVEDDNEDAAKAIAIIRGVSTNIAVVRQILGAEALDYLRQVAAPPQLILLDIGLPRMDGVTFAKEMKKIKTLESVPVIVLTGVPLDVARAHAASVATAYLVKPVDIERFKKVLDELHFTY